MSEKGSEKETVSRGIASAILRVIEKESENVIATATATTIAHHHVPAVTTTAITIVSAGTERMRGSGSTVAGLIEVRMMSSPMEMSDHQVHDAGDKMTTMKRLEEIQETQR